MDAAEPIDGGRYRLVELLGSGGMAAVYRAWDERLRAWRAVKVLNARASGSASVRSRFEDEARAMARLAHRNILTVHEFGMDGERPFIVMELVAGGSLADVLEKQGALRPALACEVLAKVLDALQFAHDNQVVHRDIKPHNIMLAADGSPLVADFGIARVGGELESGRTRTGVMMGTLAYMAPEQRSSARRVDGRADVYAAGNTLYALVTGEEPFDLHAMPDDDAQWARLPGPLAGIVRRATRHAPDARYATAAEMAADLRAAMPAIADVPGGVSSFGVATQWDSSPPLTPAPVARRESAYTVDLDALDPRAPLAPPPARSPDAPSTAGRARAPWGIAALAGGGLVGGLGLVVGLGALLGGAAWFASPGRPKVPAIPQVSVAVDPPPRSAGLEAEVALEEALAARAAALAACDRAELAAFGGSLSPWEADLRVQRGGRVKVELRGDFSPQSLRDCREAALADLRVDRVDEPFDRTHTFTPASPPVAAVGSVVAVEPASVGSGSVEVSMGSYSLGGELAVVEEAPRAEPILDATQLRRDVNRRARPAVATCVKGAEARGVDLAAVRATVVLTPDGDPTVRLDGGDDTLRSCLSAGLRRFRPPAVVERQEVTIALRNPTPAASAD